MSGTSADPGAQPERTALAWQRTGLAVVVVSLAVLRLAALRGSPAGAVVAALAALLAVAALVRVRFGYDRSSADVAADEGAVTMAPAASTAAAIALLAVAALAVELS